MLFVSILTAIGNSYIYILGVVYLIERGPSLQGLFWGFSGGSSGFQFASGFPRGDSAVRSWTSPGVGREWTETGLKPDRNRTAEAGLAILKTNWAATEPNSGPKPDQDQANTGPKSARNLTEAGPKLD